MWNHVEGYVRQQNVNLSHTGSGSSLLSLTSYENTAYTEDIISNENYKNNN